MEAEHTEPTADELADAADYTPGPPPMPADAEEVDDAEEPTQDDVLKFWALMFQSWAADAADALDALDGIENPTQAGQLAAAFNAIGTVAVRTGTIIAAWLEGVPADEPELLAAADDPGDLTCPRCDGPIALAALQSDGICATCLLKAQGVGFGTVTILTQGAP